VISVLEVAVNLYQTSYTGVPQAGAGIPEDNVAPPTFPAVFVHDEPGVSEIAPEQSSFANSFQDTILLRTVAAVVGDCVCAGLPVAPAAASILNAAVLD
jgi:molybdopterin biosynthesis enzyme MoaB